MNEPLRVFLAQYANLYNDKYLLTIDKRWNSLFAVVFGDGRSMKFGATVFLRVVLVLIGAGGLAFLLWEPSAEGVNAHATFSQIYFKDPFVAYMYAASIPFFAGLYHAFKVLGFAGKNQEFSPSAVRSVRTIKYCAMAIIGFVLGAEAIIVSHESDDHAGGVMMGVLIIFVAAVVATAMAVLERALQNAVELKSENDLTV